MGLGTDIMGLSTTGWEVKASTKLLIKAAVGISIGGGNLTAKFSAKGKPVFVSGPCFGLGVGAGGEFVLGKEAMRSLMKFAGFFKFGSMRSDLYRYAVTNNEEPTPERLAECDLVLTTMGGSATIIGGSVDYWAFYKKGEPNIPRWVWFSAGGDVTGGGSASIMQYKTDSLTVETP